MRIWFPATTSKMTVTQVASGGITFKVGTCRAYPCTLTNVATVSSSVKVGSYPVQVKVTSGTSTAVGAFVVHVLPPASLQVSASVSGPITLRKNPNGSVSGSNKVNIVLLAGTPEKLTLTSSEYPDGVNGKTIVGTCTPPCSVTNSLSVTFAAESGRYPMVIGIDGATVHTNVGYDLNIGAAPGFGMHFDAEKRTFTQNRNPTALIEMDYPFDLLVDGGTPEIATLSYSTTNASTSVTYSKTSCMLPCMGMNAHITMLQNMKVGTFSLTLIATVNRQEDDGKGGTKTVKYTERWTIPLKIVELVF